MPYRLAYVSNRCWLRGNNELVYCPVNNWHYIGNCFDRSCRYGWSTEKHIGIG